MISSVEGEYHVRSYRPGDRERFLALYERVWGQTRGTEWFEWRFERNPYTTGVEMVVAERDGDLVGAEPLLPFRFCLGDADLFAYQPVEWMVDPDHRRKGLFTRMTDRLIDQYSDRGDLLYNFPTEMLLPGLRKFDWRVVGPLPRAYRVQYPPAVLSHKHKAKGVSGASVVATMSKPFLNSWLRLCDRLRGTVADVTVERHESLPVAELVSLARTVRPTGLHVVRDRSFYEWRFDSPRWETTTYLAREAGRPVAAIVAATERFDAMSCTQLLDVQPMQERSERSGHSERSEHSGVFAALLGELLRDNQGVDVVKAPSLVCEHTLRDRGFLRDDAFPLSAVATPMTHVVRPLSADGDLSWAVGGRDLTDPDTWQLALADVEVG